MKMNLGWVSVKLGVAVMCSLFGLASLGCYQRMVAPVVTYDQTEVDSLGAEFEKFDWE